MDQPVAGHRGDAMGHRDEIVDEQQPVEPEFLLQRRWIDHPGAVGQPDRGAFHRRGQRDYRLARQRQCLVAGESAPCIGQPRMIRDPIGTDDAKLRCRPILGPRAAEAGMGSADVDGDDFSGHVRTIAATPRKDIP